MSSSRGQDETELLWTPHLKFGDPCYVERNPLSVPQVIEVTGPSGPEVLQFGGFRGWSEEIILYENSFGTRVVLVYPSGRLRDLTAEEMNLDFQSSDLGLFSEV